MKLSVSLFSITIAFEKSRQHVSHILIVYLNFVIFFFFGQWTFLIYMPKLACRLSERKQSDWWRKRDLTSSTTAEAAAQLNSKALAIHMSLILILIRNACEMEIRPAMSFLSSDTKKFRPLIINPLHIYIHYWSAA